jgi:hypothetical protein
MCCNEYNSLTSNGLSTTSVINDFGYGVCNTAGKPDVS